LVFRLFAPEVLAEKVLHISIVVRGIWLNPQMRPVQVVDTVSIPLF
jgi:hypothetical protein